MDELRIAVLAAGLADQIAAGEVVERPASVVKELVENSIDAGARRVVVELEDGGATAIRVRDDGRGIHPEDLALSLQRHATSKIQKAEQLIDVTTLGFRGEALASIAAVARIRIRSRRTDAEVGTEIASVPGEPTQIGPKGMPMGTQVEVQHLFAAIPARRKFLRSEATEVGHCCDAVIRAALVHPEVQFSLTHGGRELLRFPAADQPERIAQVLGRRARGPWFTVAGECRGVQVQAVFAPPEQATRQRNGVFIVVRRRVVTERSLSKILTAAYDDVLPSGGQPVVCLIVEPPAGTVDVNVHPQKAEVRFSDPQTVYAAVREVLEAGLVDAPWRQIVSEDPEAASETPSVAGGARAALDGWTRSDAAGRVDSGSRAAPGHSSRGYKLPTRALTGDYGQHKRDVEQRVERIDAAMRMAPSVAVAGESGGVSTTRSPDADRDRGPQLVACLAGPTAVFVLGDSLIAADLRQVRAHLLRRRLRKELAAVKEGRGIPAQALLNPVVLQCSSVDHRVIVEGSDALEELGIVAEDFGDESIVVRALPVQLRNCVDKADVRDLIDRMIPWLRMRDAAGTTAREQAVDAMAETRGSDPAPRFARRWIAELLDEGASLEAIPGVRVWTPGELTEASDV